MTNFNRSLFLFLLMFTARNMQAQNGYMVNDDIKDFRVQKILNHSQPASTFRELNGRLLIVDFFGTWCSPCLKALPKLAALQEKYKPWLNIILVSEEPQSKLEAFLKKQASFTLPIVVDEEKLFIKGFQPPSYPYTVVIGRNGKVLAIPAPEALTAGNIEQWISEGNQPALPEQPAAGVRVEEKRPVTPAAAEVPTNTLVQLSQNLVYAAKTGEATSAYTNSLQQLSMDELRASLKTDDDKKAFWINLYNAYTQIALQKDPGLHKKRNKFFKSKQVWVAGRRFSLDDIEHGILRRSKIKWSLGYFNKLFPGKTEKALRVQHLDYRLHFALNCGAKSCPPIAFYDPAKLQQQLDMATRSYLSGEAVYNEQNNTVHLPALMGWFRHDFGGKKNMRKLLQQLSIIPEGTHPKIKFSKYDWTLYLQNYKS